MNAIHSYLIFRQAVMFGAVGRYTTTRCIKQATGTFDQPGVLVCAHRIAVQTLLGGHGVDGLVAVQQQQSVQTLSYPPVAAALHDVG